MRHREFLSFTLHTQTYIQITHTSLASHSYERILSVLLSNMWLILRAHPSTTMPSMQAKRILHLTNCAVCLLWHYRSVSSWRHRVNEFPLSSLTSSYFSVSFFRLAVVSRSLSLRESLRFAVFESKVKNPSISRSNANFSFSLLTNPLQYCAERFKFWGSEVRYRTSSSSERHSQSMPRCVHTARRERSTRLLEVRFSTFSLSGLNRLACLH